MHGGGVARFYYYILPPLSPSSAIVFDESLDVHDMHGCSWTRKKKEEETRLSRRGNCENEGGAWRSCGDSGARVKNRDNV